jgi:hypothetical protein
MPRHLIATPARRTSQPKLVHTYSPLFTSLWEQTPQPLCFLNAFDADAQGGEPRGDLLLLDFAGIRFGDLALQGRRHQDVARQHQQLFIGERLGFGKAGHGFVFGGVFFEVRKVQPVRVEDPANGIRYSDDPCSVTRQRECRDRADVAEALNRRGGR